MGSRGAGGGRRGACLRKIHALLFEGLVHLVEQGEDVRILLEPLGPLLDQLQDLVLALKECE